jgi:hypothetical protein
MKGKYQMWLTLGLSCLFTILPCGGYGADISIGNSVSTTGNWTVNGTISATSFTGNGSGLTNLDPAKLSSGTANINVSGNASTVTNGVYSSGSYADPPWITSLSPGKLTAGTASINISGNAATATTANSVAALGVTTTSLANGAVTTNKLAPDAVTPSNIAFYRNVAVVATFGGDYTNPAFAMNDHGTWCGTPSATNLCLLKIMPGVYDIGTGTVVMVPYLDIEGSGQNVTVITGTVNSGINPPTLGVINGANNAEIRFLTVNNTGNGDVAILNVSQSLTMTNVTVNASGWGTTKIAIENFSCSPTMTNVTANASGGTYNYAVSNDSSASTMTNVTATASGGTDSYGVYNPYSSPTMTNVTANASGAANNYAVYSASINSSPVMTNVTVTASGGANNYGVYNYYSASPTMTNVTVTASGGANNYGVYNYYYTISAPLPVMTNVTVTASGGTNNYGIYNDSSASPAMTNVTATAKDGAGDNNGVYNKNSSAPAMINVIASGTGGTNSYGVYNDSSQPIMKDVLTFAQSASGLNVAIRNDGSSSYPILTNVTANAYGGTNAIGLFNIGSAGRVNIDRSTFSGLGGSVESRGIRNDSNQTIKVGSSKISGTVGGLGAPPQCIYCYDGNYAQLNGSCQ